MTKAELQKQVLDLPIPEKLELVEDVLGSLQASDIPIPDWQRQELRDRLEKYGSERGQLWEEVRTEIWPAAE